MRLSQIAARACGFNTEEPSNDQHPATRLVAMADVLKQNNCKPHVSAASSMVRQLCIEAAGVFAPSLAWGFGRSVQAAHHLGLLVVGLYAIILPRVCPPWLDQNIEAEADRVGNPLEKQKYIFQVTVTVLSILNFMCLAMLALASRAMKSDAISRLVAEAWDDGKARAHIIAEFRQAYAISVRMLVLVVLIYTSISMVSDMPNPVSFVFGWTPAFFPAWVMMQVVAFIRLMAALSRNEVEVYFRELEATGSGCLEAQDFAKQVTPGHWLHMLQRHQVLLKNLNAMSRSIAATVLLFQNVIAGSSLLLLWVARACQQSPTSSSGFVLLAFVLVCSGIAAMLPLALITDLCQSRRLGRRSLIALADKYSGWPMSPEVHAEYMRFMQHIYQSEAGIYVPSMGLVTRSSLIHKIMFYVKVLPLALAVTFGWWRRG
eukprot:gb/GFBE01006029.1/.p1 GENE.gb/GFBE01006029.1/~~gb/GFBE01006029.1/.p1  ORF type:complete len:431 (+),score=77.36 gb/GFBE01006029.1/:1-1293(+)